MPGLMGRFMDETIMSNIRYISKDLFAPFTSQKNSRNQTIEAAVSYDLLNHQLYSILTLKINLSILKINRI